MAGTKVQIKRSSVAGRVPSASDIDVGQLAINFTDKRFFTKDGSNTIIEVFGQSLNTTANVTFRDGAFANISATTLAGNLAWSYITSKPDLKISITGDATGNNTFSSLANGSINLTLANTAVTPGTYGNSSVIPVLTVDSKGRITAATTNAVAGITGYSYTSANNTFAITAGDGSVYKATIGTVNTLSVSNTLIVTGVGTFSNDVSIAGNLSVLGVTSFVNTTQLDIGDNIITLNAGVTGTPTLSAGIEINRGDAANVSLLWDETSDAWTFTNDGTTFTRIASNNDLDNAVSNLLTQIDDQTANAYSNATSYADGVASAAYSNATSYADVVANTAYSNAVSTAAADADAKANTAYSNAVSYADDVANTAYSNAIFIAAGLADDAYSNATSYADTKAATAYSNATSYADTKAAAAYSNATSYADTKAATAYSNATSYADTKAAAAYSNATSYADTKAATAYSNAVSVAATDASTKAGTAYTNAVSFATTAAGQAYTNAVSYADTKAATAYSNATSYADTKAATAYSNATSYADTKAAAAYSNAISVAATDASTKAAAAYANAYYWANAYAAAAYSNAVSVASMDASGKANVAYSNAVLTASNDATTKAATAYSNAVATAAADASSKVLTAYINAISMSATYSDNAAATAYTNATSYADTVATTAYNNAVTFATNKAANAYSNAIAYAASNTYVNSTFAPKASPTFTGTVVLPAVSANGSTGSAGQVLTSNGTATYWSTVTTGGGGSFTNGQSISVANLVVTNIATVKSVSANGATGTAGQVLTSDGANVYWSNPSGGNTFGTIVVAGQSNVVADSATDTLTLVAGDNIVITTNASTDAITISSTASGGGSTGNNAGNAFIAGRDNFIGDGTTTTFTLSRTATANSILVLAEGLVQFHNEDYDVSGTTLTMSAAPANNEHLEIIHIAGASTYHFMQYGAIDTFTGDGSTTGFALSRSANTSTATVYLDGLLQTPTTDFSISGTTLTFTAAPLNAETVLVYHTDSVSTAVPGTAISSTDAFAGDGTTTAFTLTGAANTSTIMVTVNGLLQGYSTEYSVTGTTLNFNEAPPNGSVIQAMRLAGSVGQAFNSVVVGTSVIAANSAASTLTFANTAGVTLSASGSTISVGVTDIAKQSFTGDGTTTSFTLTYSATSDNIFVYVNGIYFHPDEDYTVSGTTLTFTTAPVDTSQIRIRFMRAPSGLISLMGDLSSGSGSYDMETMTGGSVDLGA